MPKATKERKPVAAKKEKKVKDPNAPKKPLGAYMCFCKEMRPQVKEDNPGYSVTDVGKRLGELWKELDSDAKQKYQKMADEDKQRYNAEQAAYTKKKDAVAAKDQDDDDEVDDE